MWPFGGGGGGGHQPYRCRCPVRTVRFRAGCCAKLSSALST